MMLVDDLLEENLVLVFCGTALSDESYRRRAYYAHPGNRFYAVLDSVGFTERRLSPGEYPELLGYGIGLTDLNKTEHGADHSLNSAAFDPGALEGKIRRFSPDYLAFTSKRAAQEYLRVSRCDYGLQDTCIGRTRIFVLPSPSGRAVRYWSEEPWRELAGLYRVAFERRRGDAKGVDSIG
ncbi:mismatch-specific DNA-glycosylase [Thioalkalivibrio sp. HK1]|uniref:mismatch-specific DNA-glycosylase n=1 Tax=Thioalkalivibrio sp. HK1 TaxID=1469245 RepID=UPI00046F9E0E|nr:mismatch-specific DNA-glycosylase [Thioalkalivibrio sp. HK1]